MRDDGSISAGLPFGLMLGSAQPSRSARLCASRSRRPQSDTGHRFACADLALRDGRTRPSVRNAGAVLRMRPPQGEVGINAAAGCADEVLE